MNTRITINTMQALTTTGTAILYAEPARFGAVADGFCFSSVAEFDEEASECLDEYGHPEEYFSISFFSGSDEEECLFHACRVDQWNYKKYLEITANISCSDYPTLAYLIGNIGLNMYQAIGEMKRYGTFRRKDFEFANQVHSVKVWLKTDDFRLFSTTGVL